MNWRKGTFLMTAAAMTAGVGLSALAGEDPPFSDDFEVYTAGQPLTPQTADWEPWCFPAGADGVVSTDQANSGTKSYRVDSTDGTTDDTVHRIVADTGMWEITVWTYVPTGAINDSFVIALNQYMDDFCNGPNNWSLQVALNASTGEVESQQGGGAGGTNTVQPLRFDEWVPVRTVIDLDADVASTFYGADPLSEDFTWSEGVSGGGLPQIRALDLFANTNAGPIFYDDVFVGPPADESDVFCFDTVTTNRGLVVSGTEADACGSDDSRWQWRPDALAATVVAPINLTLEGTTTVGNPTELRFNIETAATDPGVVLGVEIFNFATNAFEGSIFTNIPTSDTVFTVTKDTNADQYVDGAGNVITRVRWFRPAGVPPLWNILIDDVSWEVDG